MVVLTLLCVHCLLDISTGISDGYLNSSGCLSPGLSPVWRGGEMLHMKWSDVWDLLHSNLLAEGINRRDRWNRVGHKMIIIELIDGYIGFMILFSLFIMFEIFCNTKILMPCIKKSDFFVSPLLPTWSIGFSHWPLSHSPCFLPCLLECTLDKPSRVILLKHIRSSHCSTQNAPLSSHLTPSKSPNPFQ